MNIDINDYSNPMNFEFNTFQNNRINIGNNDLYQVNDFQQNNKNLNNNIYSYDKRLVLCLKYLRLNKYIPNFIKRGIKFEDFLSLSNNDLTSFKIPLNVQDIIQKFMIDYFNFGSMYTIDEIVKFFKTKKTKRYSLQNDDINLNVRNKENMNYNKYKSVNNKRIPNNYNNNNYNQNMNINNEYLQNNLNDKMMNIIRRPKSQSNKMLSHTNYFSQNKRNVQNNLNKKVNINNNLNNMRIHKNSIHRKNNPNNIYDNTDISNGNMSSLPSNQNNNLNFYSSSIDNFSHMAMKENSPQLLNIMKASKHKNINNTNINQLKKNLVKKFAKAKQIKNSADVNINNRNKKIIDNNQPENMGLSRSTSKDIIKKMDEILKRYGSRKKSTNSSINLNMNKGYYSDENLKAKRNLQKQILNNNLNDINLEGYEINTYYAGDTSKLSSLYNNNDNINSEIKQMKKGGNIHHHSKINKAKKINEEQTRKIEYLLAHGGNSSLKSDNYLLMNDYGFNDNDEISLITDNKSKTNFTNYTNINNNYNNIDINGKQKKFTKKNNYMNQVNQVNNNINSSKQKNLLIQRGNYQNKISKNKPNNFNTYASNRKNNSSNYYKNNNYNNNIEENIRLNNNIIHIQNQNKLNKNDGPIQISLKNNKKYKNNNIIIPPNYNNIKERKNDFNNFNNFSLSQNNNSISNYSMGNKIPNKNMINYPLNNNNINNFINIKNNKQKRNTKSYDKQMKNRVYPGIHNINNNINNININNINYDGKRLSDGFNNLIDFDMDMNYHRTQNNFYQPNNLLNNNDEFNVFY